VRAVHEVAALTRFTFAVLSAKETYTDSLPDFPIGNVGSNGVDAADDLVPRHAWKSKTRERSFDRCHVGMTDAAGFHADAYLRGPWFTNW
jgi:hypothetical protein